MKLIPNPLYLNIFRPVFPLFKINTNKVRLVCRIMSFLKVAYTHFYYIASTIYLKLHYFPKTCGVTV